MFKPGDLSDSPPHLGKQGAVGKPLNDWLPKLGTISNVLMGILGAVGGVAGHLIAPPSVAAATVSSHSSHTGWFGRQQNFKWSDVGEQGRRKLAPEAWSGLETLSGLFGDDLTVTSGWRSKEHQQSLMIEMLRENPQQFLKNYGWRMRYGNIPKKFRTNLGTSTDESKKGVRANLL